uniref:DUF667 domain-containing protein n=1 Tax=Trichuris muris TaxID=70415 RepID=A0A5S6QE63_TRIMR
MRNRAAATCAYDPDSPEKRRLLKGLLHRSHLAHITLKCSVCLIQKLFLSVLKSWPVKLRSLVVLSGARMFRNTYQSGLISLLSSVGYEPLQLWGTEVRNGSIKRIQDEEICDMVIEIVSRDVRETSITFPANRDDALAIKLPLVAFLVKNLNRDFSFEVELVDVKGDKHWLRANSFQKKSRESQLICTMPLRMEEGWNYVQMDVSDLTKRAFGRRFAELLRIQVHANCRLRRIFCADRIYSEDELPPEFRLYRAD